MCRAIFWDNDGVLVDTEPLYFRATKEILARISIELTREVFVRMSLREGRSVFDLARSQGLGAAEIDRLKAARNARYSELLRAGVSVRDGVRETLRAVHGKLAMGIVTSSRREHFDLIHRRSRLLPYFNFVLTSEDYQRSKPDPEPYRLAAERNGLRAAQCIVVEDSERGLMAAKAAGMRCFVVPTELTRDGDFAAADKVLTDVREVATEVLRLLEG